MIKDFMSYCYSYLCKYFTCYDKTLNTYYAGILGLGLATIVTAIASYISKSHVWYSCRYVAIPYSAKL